MTDLLHHGLAMKREPSNISLTTLLGQLRAGQAAYVRLEPGDATRYDLVLWWGPTFVAKPDRMKFMMVTRIVSGNPSRGALVPMHVRIHDTARISGDNQWAAVLLAWWLREVWALLVPEVAFELATIIDEEPSDE